MSLGESIEAIIREQVAAEVARIVRPDLSEAFREAGRIEALKRRALLSAEEVEAVYGIKAETLKKWRAEKRGPRYVEGTPARYRVSEIEAWLSSHTVRTHGVA